MFHKWYKHWIYNKLYFLINADKCEAVWGKNKIPRLDSSAFAFTVARFESVFLSTYFVYLYKTHVMNEHFV